MSDEKPKLGRALFGDLEYARWFFAERKRNKPSPKEEEEVVSEHKQAPKEEEEEVVSDQNQPAEQEDETEEGETELNQWDLDCEETEHNDWQPDFESEEESDGDETEAIDPAWALEKPLQSPPAPSTSNHAQKMSDEKPKLGHALFGDLESARRFFADKKRYLSSKKKDEQTKSEHKQAPKEKEEGVVGVVSDQNQQEHEDETEEKKTQWEIDFDPKHKNGV